MDEALLKLKDAKGDNYKLSDIGSELFEDIVAEDAMASQGIGSDNMTCVVVELLH